MYIVWILFMLIFSFSFNRVYQHLLDFNSLQYCQEIKHLLPRYIGPLPFLCWLFRAIFLPVQQAPSSRKISLCSQLLDWVHIVVNELSFSLTDGYGVDFFFMKPVVR